MELSSSSSQVRFSRLGSESTTDGKTDDLCRSFLSRRSALLSTSSIAMSELSEMEDGVKTACDGGKGESVATMGTYGRSKTTSAANFGALSMVEKSTDQQFTSRSKSSYAMMISSPTRRRLLGDGVAMVDTERTVSFSSMEFEIRAPGDKRVDTRPGSRTNREQIPFNVAEEAAEFANEGQLDGRGSLAKKKRTPTPAPTIRIDHNEIDSDSADDDVPTSARKEVTDATASAVAPAELPNKRRRRPSLNKTRDPIERSAAATATATATTTAARSHALTHPDSSPLSTSQRPIPPQGREAYRDLSIIHATEEEIVALASPKSMTSGAMSAPASISSGPFLGSISSGASSASSTLSKSHLRRNPAAVAVPFVRADHNSNVTNDSESDSDSEGVGLGLDFVRGRSRRSFSTTLLAKAQGGQESPFQNRSAATDLFIATPKLPVPRRNPPPKEQQPTGYADLLDVDDEDDCNAIDDEASASSFQIGGQPLSREAAISPEAAKDGDGVDHALEEADDSAHEAHQSKSSDVSKSRSTRRRAPTPAPVFRIDHNNIDSDEYDHDGGGNGSDRCETGSTRSMEQRREVDGEPKEGAVHVKGTRRRAPTPAPTQRIDHTVVPSDDDDDGDNYVDDDHVDDDHSDELSVSQRETSLSWERELARAADEDASSGPLGLSVDIISVESTSAVEGDDSGEERCHDSRDGSRGQLQGGKMSSFRSGDELEESAATPKIFNSGATKKNGRRRPATPAPTSRIDHNDYITSSENEAEEFPANMTTAAAAAAVSDPPRQRRAATPAPNRRIDHNNVNSEEDSDSDGDDVQMENSSKDHSAIFAVTASGEPVAEIIQDSSTVVTAAEPKKKPRRRAGTPAPTHRIDHDEVNSDEDSDKADDQEGSMGSTQRSAMLVTRTSGEPVAEIIQDSSGVVAAAGPQRKPRRRAGTPAPTHRIDHHDVNSEEDSENADHQEVSTGSAQCSTMLAVTANREPVAEIIQVSSSVVARAEPKKKPRRRAGTPAPTHRIDHNDVYSEEDSDNENVHQGSSSGDGSAIFAVTASGEPVAEIIQDSSSVVVSAEPKKKPRRRAGTPAPTHRIDHNDVYSEEEGDGVDVQQGNSGENRSPIFAMTASGELVTEIIQDSSSVVANAVPKKKPRRRAGTPAPTHRIDHNDVQSEEESNGVDAQQGNSGENRSPTFVMTASGEPVTEIIGDSSSVVASAEPKEKPRRRAGAPVTTHRIDQNNAPSEEGSDGKNNNNAPRVQSGENRSAMFAVRASGEPVAEVIQDSSSVVAAAESKKKPRRRAGTPAPTYRIDYSDVHGEEDSDGDDVQQSKIGENHSAMCATTSSSEPGEEVTHDSSSVVAADEPKEPRRRAGTPAPTHRIDHNDVNSGEDSDDAGDKEVRTGSAQRSAMFAVMSSGVSVAEIILNSSSVVARAEPKKKPRRRAGTPAPTHRIDHNDAHSEEDSDGDDTHQGDSGKQRSAVFAETSSGEPIAEIIRNSSSVVASAEPKKKPRRRAGTPAPTHRVDHNDAHSEEDSDNADGQEVKAGSAQWSAMFATRTSGEPLAEVIHEASSVIANAEPKKRLRRRAGTPAPTHRIDHNDVHNEEDSDNADDQEVRTGSAQRSAMFVTSTSGEPVAEIIQHASNVATVVEPMKKPRRRAGTPAPTHRIDHNDVHTEEDSDSANGQEGSRGPVQRSAMFAVTASGEPVTEIIHDKSSMIANAVPKKRPRHRAGTPAPTNRIDHNDVHCEEDIDNADDQEVSTGSIHRSATFAVTACGEPVAEVIRDLSSVINDAEPKKTPRRRAGTPAPTHRIDHNDVNSEEDRDDELKRKDIHHSSDTVPATEPKKNPRRRAGTPAPTHRIDHEDIHSEDVEADYIETPKRGVVFARRSAIFADTASSEPLTEIIQDRSSSGPVAEAKKKPRQRADTPAPTYHINHNNVTSEDEDEQNMSSATSHQRSSMSVTMVGEPLADVIQNRVSAVGGMGPRKNPRRRAGTPAPTSRVTHEDADSEIDDDENGWITKPSHSRSATFAMTSSGEPQMEEILEPTTMGWKETKGAPAHRRELTTIPAPKNNRTGDTCGDQVDESESDDNRPRTSTDVSDNRRRGRAATPAPATRIDHTAVSDDDVGDYHVSIAEQKVRTRRRAPTPAPKFRVYHHEVPNDDDSDDDNDDVASKPSQATAATAKTTTFKEQLVYITQTGKQAVSFHDQDITIESTATPPRRGVAFNDDLNTVMLIYRK